LFRIIRSVIPTIWKPRISCRKPWVRVFEHLKQFEGRASFATWVSRIAFHESLARARKGKRWTLLEDKEGEIVPEANRHHASPETPETQAMRSELGRVLQAAVDSLPAAYRVVFVLREVEQLSTVETADCLGVSQEAVKTRLHRSRALLRRDLEGRIGPAVTEAYAFLGSRCDRTVARVLQRIG
jgi:RNA polymerase sigma-70 factor (ECF subfamily)